MSENLKQLKDLSNKAARSTVAVIDAVTQRGGFKGEELTTIGGLRDQWILIFIIENTSWKAGKFLLIKFDKFM